MSRSMPDSIIEERLRSLPMLASPIRRRKSGGSPEVRTEDRRVRVLASVASRAE